MKKIIRCEEIVPDPIIVNLGAISVDVTRISAYNTIRMLKLIKDVENQTASEIDAWDLLCSIVAEQGQNIREEDILKAGTVPQVQEFIGTIVAHTLRTYSPLETSVSPFFRLPTKRQAKGK